MKQRIEEHEEKLAKANASWLRDYYLRDLTRLKKQIKRKEDIEKKLKKKRG